VRADSRALLELLLERGQGYDDIAEVLGTGHDEVRERASAALAELGGAEPDPELTDYLLGQADPVGRADAVRRLNDDPEALELASRLVDGLRAIAPQAQLPRLAQPRRRRVAADKGMAVEAAGPGLSRRQRLVIAALAAGALLVLGIAAAVGGVFDSGDEAGAPAPSASQDADALRVKLEPQGGSHASGQGVFGLATADQLFLDLDVKDLAVPDPDHTYVVWLLLTPDRGYPVSPLAVDDNGNFSDRFPIPRFAAPIAGRARYLDVGLADRDELGAQVQNFAKRLNKGSQAQLPILDYQGESALRGEIPATGGPALLDEGSGGGS